MILKWSGMIYEIFDEWNRYIVVDFRDNILRIKVKRR